MTTVEIRLPPLHPTSREVFDDPSRFKVLACGRRWGKTTLGALTCIVVALRGGQAWWVAPSYPIANIGWRKMKALSRKVPGIDKSESERRIVFPGGGWVQVKSADNPDSLRGEGLDMVVLDECAFIKEAAWSAALRPALADKQGGAMFISTPKGRNWFWRLWLRGQSGESGWRSWSFPTENNPKISAEEIDEARRAMPELYFRQEFLAEFVEDAGGVFRRVMEAATVEMQSEPEPGHEYVFGVDWGKHNDFTVITVLDLRDRRVVYLDRFRQIDYYVQVGRLRALYETWRPTAIIAEINSMGEPLIEQLQRAGLPVQPFLTTNATKTVAIDALALAFERGEIAIPNDPILVGELQAFQMERMPSGALRYLAPEGVHDDCVMSLAFAWQGCDVAAPAFVEL